MVPEGGQLLLLVDQFEELFTLSPEAEQRAFLEGITHALTVPDSRLRVVATLRADYYDRPLAVQPFGSLVQDATVTIPAMLPAEIEAAVVEPARRADRTVERALAAELVAALATEPAALPALQFVLFELAEHSPDGTLSLAAYRALGGIEGAIASRAEQLYLSLDDADRGAGARALRAPRRGGRRGRADPPPSRPARSCRSRRRSWTAGPPRDSSPSTSTRRPECRPSRSPTRRWSGSGPDCGSGSRTTATS